MLAYTVIHFDVKTKDGKRPLNPELHNVIMPNPIAEILYRRRSVEV
jgi:hypothetical protein